ncbi:MAG TPA: hypothetical protein VHV77_06845, partial [Pirellulales bacterium]|nr:hypothetical protein [Pirellulales bacterium]
MGSGRGAPAAIKAAPRSAAFVALGLGFFGLTTVFLSPATVPAIEPSAEESVFFPTDRPLMQRLATAEALISDQRWGEAVRLLVSLLEAPEDYFFQPDRKAQIFRSLKTEAQRLLGELPSEGRESYETQFGAQARKLLDAAIDTGNVDGLAEVSRRFFHTRAGYEATELLGTAHMERDRPLPAALCFKRLKETPLAAQRFEPLLSIKLAICWARVGQWGEAVDVLVPTAQRYSDLSILVAGRQRKLLDVSPAPHDDSARSQLDRKPTTDDLRALAWLEDVGARPRAGNADAKADEWPLFRGSPSRNATSRGGTPLLNRRWAVPVINDPQIEKLSEQLRQSYVDQGLAALPSLSPLAVDNFVFMRSVAGLVAVDFKTGKRIWNGPADEGARYLLDPANIDSNAVDASALAGWLDQRLWDDNVYGAMSSDGQSIYCVEDLVDEVPTIGPRVFGPHGRILNGAANTEAHDRLAAYSIASEGKLEWELSVSSGEENSPLAGAFFLGPPLPLSGRLYVLAEIKGEIRLLALRPKTDGESRAKSVEVEWSQQLAMVERNIAEDGPRRLAGAVPSFADGILVCPTSAGAVVAVDLTTRSLLWGYRYPRGIEVSARSRMAQSRMSDGASEHDHWSDATVTIAGGRVLLTPVEAGSSTVTSELHCLNLLDGSLV